jgi:CRP-like cAMP-binding protein
MSFKSIIELPEWEHFGHLFERSEIPARTMLLWEGEVSQKVYFIEKGCLRLWLNHNGKDITLQFFFEGEGAYAVESFKMNTPGIFNLESIEPCLIWTISKENLQIIAARSSQVQEKIDAHTFQQLLNYQHLFVSRIKHNPQKRYEELLKQHPRIIQRVPVHYIASYLGITPVSLSRIRNRR